MKLNILDWTLSSQREHGIVQILHQHIFLLIIVRQCGVMCGGFTGKIVLCFWPRPSIFFPLSLYSYQLFYIAGVTKKYKGPKKYNATDSVKATISYRLGQHFYKNIIYV